MFSPIPLSPPPPSPSFSLPTRRFSPLLTHLISWIIVIVFYVIIHFSLPSYFFPYRSQIISLVDSSLSQSYISNDLVHYNTLCVILFIVPMVIIFVYSFIEIRIWGRVRITQFHALEYDMWKKSQQSNNNNININNSPSSFPPPPPPANYYSLSALLLHFYFYFSGLILTFLLTISLIQSIKYVAQRPRPDFIMRCFNMDTVMYSNQLLSSAPSYLFDTKNCVFDTSINKYIADAFLTFPSGHSATAWCCCIYLFLFLVQWMGVGKGRGREDEEEERRRRKREEYLHSNTQNNFNNQQEITSLLSMPRSQMDDVKIPMDTVSTPLSSSSSIDSPLHSSSRSHLLSSPPLSLYYLIHNYKGEREIKIGFGEKIFIFLHQIRWKNNNNNNNNNNNDMDMDRMSPSSPSPSPSLPVTPSSPLFHRLLPLITPCSLLVPFLPLVYSCYVSASRLYDHRHHPLDVIVGGIMGASIAWAVWRGWTMKYEEKRRREFANA